MMNSTLKPVLPTTAQTSSPTPNKPMHPQGAPVSYGQPSGPIPQNPFPNTNMAHNSASSQQNHFSVNSGAAFNMSSGIPASNHPVAISQPSSGPVYNQPKNVSYASGFQNAQNQNTLPPVSQALPATTSTTPAATQNATTTITSQSPPNSTTNAESSEEMDKPQPNGTTQEPSVSEVEKTDSQENHVPETTEKPKQETSPEEPAATSESLSEVSKEQNTLEPAPVPEPSLSPVPVSASTIPMRKPADVPESSSAPVCEAAESSAAALKEAEEPETVQNDTVSADAESSKDILETDPLAIDATDAKLDQDKSVSLTETESKDEEASEDEELSNDEGSEKEEEEEDPLGKTPPKMSARKAKAAKQEPKTPGAGGHAKRQRIMTQHYQSPLPEIEIITKISTSTPRTKNHDDKLIYFYKNEFLAVRNADGGFYLCQAVQNVYKSSSKIKIRWLSQDRSDKTGQIYTPDFYDLTDFDCILTSIDLTRVGKGRYKLKPKEKERTDSILKRCLAVEKGEISQPSVSEEHPDGLDLSLYKDEEQLVKNKKRGTKRKSKPRSQSPKKHVVPAAKKTPESPKARKIESKPAKNNAPSKKVTPAAAKKPAEPEPKKAPATSRSSRGKRKSDTKGSPVVDPKKAKVLARIGRKSAIAASNSKTQTKSAKATKATPSTSKVTKPPPRKAAKRTTKK